MSLLLGNINDSVFCVSFITFLISSVAYAQMCKVMQMKKVPVDGGKEEEYVNFRKLLISRYFQFIA